MELLTRPRQATARRLRPALSLPDDLRGAIGGLRGRPADPRIDTPARLFRRSPANPILTARDLPYAINSVFNPAAVQLGGETLLLARAERFTGQSHLVVARSADGVSGWRFDFGQGLVPDPERYPEDRYGLEDPRIVEVPEFGYLVTFTSYSEAGPVVSLAATRDFRSYERFGVIAEADDKDAAILPRRFGGDWILVHRPVRDLVSPAHIRISRSRDLRSWTDAGVLLPAREGGWWDARKVGMGPPPLETEAGWLLLYHAVRTTGSGCLYRNGLALLDRDDPTRVIARSDEFVFGPEAIYERTGDVPNVVFPEGWILEPDGRTLRVYYGAADSSVCLATAQLPELLAYLRRYPVTAA